MWHWWHGSRPHNRDSRGASRQDSGGIGEGRLSGCGGCI